MRNKLCSVIAGLALAAPLSYASVVDSVSDVPEADTAMQSESNWSGMLGVGVINAPEYIGGDDNDTSVVPLISLDYKDTVYFNFNRAGIWLFKSDDGNARFGLMAKSRQGWEDGDGDLLRGLKDRDSSIDAGVNFEYRFNRFKIAADAMGNTEDGSSFDLSAGYDLYRDENLKITASVGFERLDEDLVNYYYGVDSKDIGLSQTNPKPSLYEGDAAKNVWGSLVATYKFAPRWVLMAGVKSTDLDDEIADSPLVEDDRYTSSFLAVAWTFPAPPAPVLAEPEPEPVVEPAPTRTISVRLKVEFEFDKAEVRAIYGDELRAIASAMKVHEDIELVLEGHTDSIGTEAYNQGLSERRAAAVKARIVDDYGIDPARITSVGYGEGSPIADNATDEGRARNRRVIGDVTYTEVVAE